MAFYSEGRRNKTHLLLKEGAIYLNPIKWFANITEIISFPGQAQKLTYYCKKINESTLGYVELTEK